MVGQGNPEAYKYGFGSPGRTKEFDDAAREKGKHLPKKRKWTRDRCIEELEEVMTLLKKFLREDAKTETDNPKKLKQENIRDLITMQNKMLDFMRYLYPPVQQNLNVNVDITADAVIERLKNWKKEQIIVIGENNKEVIKCQEKIEQDHEEEVKDQEMEEEMEKVEQEEKE